MCVGALVHARIRHARVRRRGAEVGAVTSTSWPGGAGGTQSSIDVVSGVREDQCRDLVQAFFKSGAGPPEDL